jgi:hypothetical protein
MEEREGVVEEVDTVRDEAELLPELDPELTLDIDEDAEVELGAAVDLDVEVELTELVVSDDPGIAEEVEILAVLELEPVVVVGLNTPV